jgi:hypothetical protein
VKDIVESVVCNPFGISQLLTDFDEMARSDRVGSNFQTVKWVGSAPKCDGSGRVENYGPVDNLCPRDHLNIVFHAVIDRFSFLSIVSVSGLDNFSPVISCRKTARYVRFQV